MEPGTAPACRRCQHRHLAALPCWGGRLVDQLRGLVLATYGTSCVHCGGPGARSVEHVQPRSMGGTDAIGNLRPAHLGCNITRGVDPMPGWGAGPVTAERSPRW